MSTIDDLKLLLLPVLGFDSVDEIESNQSLITDLGADSLDFVELVYLIEKKFGVTLETRQLMTGGSEVSESEVFVDGKLTDKGAMQIAGGLPISGPKVAPGMTKVDLFQLITVADLAHIIETRKGG